MSIIWANQGNAPRGPSPAQSRPAMALRSAATRREATSSVLVSTHTNGLLSAHLIDAFLLVAASPNPTPAVVRADGAVDHKAHVVCIVPPLAPTTPNARNAWRNWTRSW